MLNSFTEINMCVCWYVHSWLSVCAGVCDRERKCISNSGDICLQEDEGARKWTLTKYVLWGVYCV